MKADIYKIEKIIRIYQLIKTLKRKKCNFLTWELKMLKQIIKVMKEKF